MNTVVRFQEKPDTATAQACVSSGRHWWNSRIFLVSAQVLLSELEAFAPDIVHCARAALDGAVRDLDFCRLDPECFAAAPSISLDHCIMERTDKAVVLPVDFTWSDLGAWSELWQAASPDDDGNVVSGDVWTMHTRNSYLRTEGPLIAALGIEDMISSPPRTRF